MGQQSLTALPVRDAAPPGSVPRFVTPDIQSPITGSPSRKPQALRPPAADFQSLVNQVVYLARTLTGANGSAIAFRKEQGTICSARSGEGAPPLGAPVDISSGISRACLESGSALWCADITAADPEISKTVGIRAVAVAPIYCGDEISGILAVFSVVPRIFTALHLKWLQQLAGWVGSAQSTRAEKIFPPRVAESYPPLHLLNDVFIEARLPWKRFIQSVSLHVIAVAVGVGLSAIWPRVPLIASQPFRNAHIVYYPSSQSFPTYQSSRPPASTKRRHISERQQSADAHAQDRKSVARQGTSARKIDDPPVAPAMPFATSRIAGPAIAAAVSPPPDIAEANSRQLSLPKGSIIAPPPELAAGSGLRGVNAPKTMVVPPSPEVSGLTNSRMRGIRNPGGLGSGRAGDTLVVQPAPSVDDRALITNRAAGLSPGVRVIDAPPTLEPGLGMHGKGRLSLVDRGSQVVPPPPSLNGAGNLLGNGRGDSLVAGAGGSQVVPPAPSLQDARNIGGGRGGSLDAAGAGPQVVPPAPSMQEAGNMGGGRGMNSLGHGTSGPVGPPPSISALDGGNSGRGGRGNSLTGSLVADALPPEAKADIPRVDEGRAAKPLAPSPDLDLSHRVFQDMQLRVIGLAWAPPRSSYFSNFEVFIAEKRVNKNEAQIIKLVYVFLPYQRRLSQYGADALRTRRLRVTRDSTCDENMMEMMWPEDQNHPADSRSTPPSPSARRNDLLPCYITTADDYVRTVSRSR